MIRRLEGGAAGARRDHFFHSFQNYFLGVGVIERLPQLFTVCPALGWNIDPYDAWFFTVLWHDVGYSVQYSAESYEYVTGFRITDETAEGVKRSILESPNAQEAMRQIGHVMARLLGRAEASTALMPLRPQSHLAPDTQRVIEAIRANVLKSHGALGGIRLVEDFLDEIDATPSTERDRLLQAVLVAAASMPFHDMWFREHVRAQMGACVIHTRYMPFAALLAFVDSIQDDRRDLAGLQKARLILESVDIEQERLVKAVINCGGYSDEELLFKIVEARGVSDAIEGTADGLCFSYPAWLTGGG
jgi:hypothetical protein